MAKERSHENTGDDMGQNMRADSVMTAETYRALRLEHGPDMASWPQALARAAEHFLESDKGAALHGREEKLDMLLAVARHTAEAELTDGSDFLARLEAVPSRHPQENTRKNMQNKASFAVFFGGLLQKITPSLMVRGRLSPVGFAFEGVLCTLLLVAGVMVGLSGSLETAPTTENDYDLAANMFAAGGEDAYGLEE